VQKCLEGGVNHMWTLSALQLHPYALIVVDEDATLELQVKTVKYFKSIELVASSQGFGQGLESGEAVGRKRDSVLERLDSPSSPRKMGEGFLAAPGEGRPGVKRAVTPELVPDSMHERLPEDGVEGEKKVELGAMQAKEVPSLLAMHERVDSAQA